MPPETSLLGYAQQMARAALGLERVRYGPWRGSMRSVAADRVPPEYIAGGSNMRYLSKYGGWKRRGGQSIKFDTFGSQVGLLPAKWGGKCRQLEEFSSDSFSDGIPSLIALVTKETLADTTNLDDGKFAQIYILDQVNSLNYTLGNEYSATTYPAPGSGVQNYKIVPLWYDSGDGGITRGTTEFARRFFFSGSRRMEKAGDWRYFPSRHGTPSRWREQFTPLAALQQSTIPNAATETSGTSFNASSGTLLTCLNDYDSDPTGTDYAQWTVSLTGGFSARVDFDNQTSLGTSTISTTLSLKMLLRASSGLATRLVFNIGYSNSSPGDTTVVDQIAYGGPGNTTHTATNDQGNVTTGFLEYTFTTTTSGMNFAKNWFVGIVNDGLAASGTFDIGYMVLQIGNTDVSANRLIPSGPIRPTHAGTLTAGTKTTAGGTFMRPTSDITAGSWTQSTGASLFGVIDEATADDTDYITSANTGTDVAEVKLNALGFTPSVDASINVTFRAKVDSAFATLTVHLVDGTTVVSGRVFTPATTSFSAFTWNLTATEISDITTLDSSWSDVRLRFTRSQTSGATTASAYVSLGEVQHVLSEDQLNGGWRGWDKFGYAVAYQFKDGSIWAPTVPRAANAILPSGIGIFQVDASDPTAGYEKVTWGNLPVPPHDVINLILLRTPKINVQTDAALQINVNDLRVVAVVGAGTLTYDDYYADDDSLDLASILGGVVRIEDHIMPPRARYLFAGNARVAHSYGGDNPCAIELAPVSLASDSVYDLNVADDSSTAYSSTGMYCRITLDTSGVAVLELVKTSVSNKQSITLTNLTLQDLVDTINLTTTSSNAELWRAQLCPGVDPDANAEDSLLPHYRSIASCVVSGTSITKAAGGLSKVAVGAICAGATTFTSQQYVTEIVSDTELTVSASANANTTETVNFYFELGDTPTSGANLGYQRVIANSLPGFLYFNQTYLDTQTFDKAAVWETVAAPGAVRSAPNCFSGKPDYRHTPPLNAGISMGGRAVDDGFVVPFANKRAVIRDTPSGRKLIITNEASGCIAWQSLCEGNRFAAMFAPEGWIAQDLDSELLLSEATYDDRPNNLSGASTNQTSVGDYGYESAVSSAATAQDIDDSYLVGRILRSRLIAKYRNSNSDTRPSMRTEYDFSGGIESNGLSALKRSDGSAWGWSTEMSAATEAAGGHWSAMCEGRRSDGPHLYGWQDTNAGSTGDGRIDEFETGSQDNGTDISSAMPTPWLQYADDQVSLQRAVVEHVTPTSAVVSLVATRSFAASPQTQSLTLTADSTLPLIRDHKEFLTTIRPPSDAVHLDVQQTSGSATEVRGILLMVKRTPKYRPA